ncbi:MAG: hypothetical protein DWQ10_04120 [Calditrichaeota bacterium]|nr:MAG: hypothetical protein DWQ10_04120 [Calditrichota bacterium]
MKGTNVTITGIVIPADWDKHGNVVAMTIVTNSFEKYLVTNDAINSKLACLVDKQVSAKGLIAGEDLFGNKILEVHEFKVCNTNK